MHCRELETQKIIALGYSKGDFNAKMIITHSMKAELDWWIKNIPLAVRKINHGPPRMVISTDASLSGWGAVCEDMRIGGRWSLVEVGYHINYLELLAIFHALRAFCKDVTDTHVQIKSDNTSAIAYLNNMGGIKSSLSNDLAKQIWDWAVQKQVLLTACYIPGKCNSADYDTIMKILNRN